MPVPFRRLAATVATVSVVLFSAAPAGAELPTLAKVVELARTHAVFVDDARAELGAADARVAGARVSAIGNPYTDVQIDHGIGDGSALQALTYSYFPVDVGGQRGKRMEEARRFVDWRSVGVDDAKAIVTGEAVAAYGEVIIGASRLAEAKAGEQIARDEAAYFAGRLAAKDTTVYEKALADAEVTRWIQAGAEAQLGLTGAVARLAQLTGESAVDAPPGRTGRTDVAPPPLRRAWNDAELARIVDRSPVLLRLGAERGYWDASVERWEREKIPPVALELIAGRGALGEARLGGGAVITFPVTRRFQGEIARAERGREYAQSRIAGRRNAMEVRARAARDELDTVRRALRALDTTGIPALELAVGASVEAFRAGKIDLVRALLARRDLSVARSRRLDLVEAGWRAYAELAAIAGDLP